MRELFCRRLVTKFLDIFKWYLSLHALASPGGPHSSARGIRIVSTPSKIVGYETSHHRSSNDFWRARGRQKGQIWSAESSQFTVHFSGKGNAIGCVRSSVLPSVFTFSSEPTDQLFTLCMGHGHSSAGASQIVSGRSTGHAICCSGR